MARRGKVSKGCQTCRKRKIKCDLARPSCSQCHNAGWTCPQYQDAADRVFQNQTPGSFGLSQSTSARNKIVRAEYQNDLEAWDSSITVTPAKAFPLTWNGPSDDVFTSLRNLRPYGTLSRIRISPPVTERAINLFLYNHVFHHSDTPRGYFEYLPSLCSNINSNSPISLSLHAAALAAYGNTVRSRPTLNEARKYLVLAFKAVNKALESPQEAKKDTTLTAIMLLSAFETITCGNQQALKDCDTHLNAATTITKLRGHDQFRSRTGIQMFLQMFSNIIRSCLQRAVRVPADVITYRCHAAEFLGKKDPSWHLSEILIRFADLRASVQDRTLINPHHIIRTALVIDGDLCALCTTMPSDWQFRSINTNTDSESVYMGRFHIYPDLWVAHTWNNIRTCRILLHQEICSQITILQRSTAIDARSQMTQKTTSELIIQEMCAEICATIPQHAGYVSHPPQPPIPTTTQHEPPRDVPIEAATYWLLWHLLKPGEVSTGARRWWIIDRLRYLGNVTGIRQALAVAEALERRERIYVWG